MALIAVHLNAGHSGGDSVAIGIYPPSSPTSIPTPLPHLHTHSPPPPHPHPHTPLTPILPVPNKPYGFCGR